MKDKKSKQSQKPTEPAEQLDYEAMYKRALADYHNLQKQTLKEKEEFAKYAKAGVIMDMIPVYENLVSAVSYAGDDHADQWVAGVRYVIKQFEGILEENGITIIDPLGAAFNHDEHEAVEQIETDDDLLVDTVAKVGKRGYRLDGRVLQPARVSVYVLKSESEKQ